MPASSLFLFNVSVKTYISAAVSSSLFPALCNQLKGSWCFVVTLDQINASFLFKAGEPRGKLVKSGPQNQCVKEVLTALQEKQTNKNLLLNRSAPVDLAVCAGDLQALFHGVMGRYL